MPRNNSLLGPTGSLTNNIYANSKQPAPEIGMGATQLLYSDRHAFSVIKIVSPKKIVVQRDKVTRTDSNGMSESQDYNFEPNTEGMTATLTLRKNGRWVVEGEDLWSGSSFSIGNRSEYYDFTK